MLSSLAALTLIVIPYLGDSVSIATKLSNQSKRHVQDAFAATRRTSDYIPFSTRVYWMRQANAVLAELSSPCPFGAFGTVIVNHTDTKGLGNVVCIGVNSLFQIGNPTLHGEIAAINNCSSILTDPSGRYKLSPSEALGALQDLSLYTNAESCPMCASAIRWAGFKEYIYGTSIKTLTSQGWGQIQIPSSEVFHRSTGLPSRTSLIGDVLTNETDPYFAWQYNASSPCPATCKRDASGTCAPQKRS